MERTGRGDTEPPPKLKGQAQLSPQTQETPLGELGHKVPQGIRSLLPVHQSHHMVAALSLISSSVRSQQGS